MVLCCKEEKKYIKGHMFNYSKSTVVQYVNGKKKKTRKWNLEKRALYTLFTKKHLCSISLYLLKVEVHIILGIIENHVIYRDLEKKNNILMKIKKCLLHLR